MNRVGYEGGWKYGVDVFPAYVYYEDFVPTIFEGGSGGGEDLLEWIEDQRTSDTIEKVSEEMLRMIAEELKEYVGVFFTGSLMFAHIFDLHWN